MGLRVELRDEEGRRVLLDDPSGGTFDASGDFDRLVPADSPDFPVLSRVDPYADWLVPSDQFAGLASEVSVLRDAARPGPEARGLDRLARQIRACLDRPGLSLLFLGD